MKKDKYYIFSFYKMIALEFLKSELKSHNLELTPKTDGMGGVDFLIGEDQIYLQPLDLDTVNKVLKFQNKI